MIKFEKYLSRVVSRNRITVVIILIAVLVFLVIFFMVEYFLRT